MPNVETNELERVLGQLRQCVSAFRSRYGDSAGVRRLINDVDRLDIDMGDLTGRSGHRTPPEPRQGESGRPEIVVVPDTPYDPALWHGADDEGVGGVHPHR